MSLEYAEAERMALPILRIKAARVVRSTTSDFDDLIQEGRLALFRALPSYEKSRGSFRGYISTVLDNALRMVIDRERAMCRMPRVGVQRQNGSWDTAPLPPISMGDMVYDFFDEEALDPMQEAEVGELEDLRQDFHVAICSRLNARERAVWAVKIDPPASFRQITNGREPTIPQYAEYLGITRNQFGHSIRKIRLEFARLSVNDKFSDLLTNAIEDDRVKPYRTETRKMGKPELKLASCFGGYDNGDTTCDGDPESQVESESIPCALRDRCSAFRLHCEDEGLDADESAVTMDKAELIQICDSLISTLGIKEGLPEAAREEEDESEEGEPEADEAESEEDEPEADETESQEGEPEPEVEAKPAKAAKASKPKKPKPKKADAPVSHKYVLSPQLVELWDHFQDNIREQFSERKLVDTTEAAKPGTFYPRDRLQSSRYISLYCKTPKFRDVPLISARFKPRTSTLDIQLPIEEVALGKLVGKADFKKLNVKPFPDGAFRVMCVGMDKEGAAIVAEALRKMAEKGIVDLPSA